ncbi:Arginase/deacetylase [Neolentinus lepideus HHB14362 ss-1]|uniref:Arginase/deacetylase n=1 Tax=Neolentinus lepideus HHB14362 ss-1 TaxID=1314782 RepID=A0A165UM46_9AGAM|nr:Arginase/deacetylase [Neolentinus lepideus HHB14362 ss-1]
MDEDPANEGTRNLPKKLGIFFQDACLDHRYIRNRDTSSLVERPERIRAVKIGISVALSRMEDLVPPPESANVAKPKLEGNIEPDDLISALNRMAIDNKGGLDIGRGLPTHITKSAATLDLLNHSAVKFVHGDIQGDVYLEKLKSWALDSSDKVGKGESEIPEGLPQGDLYLCPTSINAIQGALGSVCEAIDAVVKTTCAKASGGAVTIASSDSPGVSRAFVAIRPPGHHCGEDTPSGFCFVNNVVVGAAHAHLQHGVNRVVILDIDLHHGNGTQSLIWQINEETYRKSTEAKYSGNTKPGLQVYYGSVHDILSYPCEDGKPELVQAASVSIHGPHGQYIENVHLQPYESLEQFWDVVYKGPYSRLLTKAGEFLDNTGGPGDDVLVFISCGLDACEHEYPSMSRHQRKVPVSFYHQFARDACAFADKYAQGRLVSLLEGGYSDRALTSGAMAHICGLAGVAGIKEEWWSVDNLMKVEKVTKKKGRGGRQSLTATGATEPWVQRTVEIFSMLDEGSHYTLPTFSSRGPGVPPSNMTLRERKKNQNYAEVEIASPPPSSPKRRGRKSKGAELPKPATAVSSEENWESATDTSIESKGETEANTTKKLPKVILHVRPPADANSK